MTTMGRPRTVVELRDDRVPCIPDEPGETHIDWENARASRLVARLSMPVSWSGRAGERKSASGERALGHSCVPNKARAFIHVCMYPPRHMPPVTMLCTVQSSPVVLYYAVPT
jgi:hypothetical protein